MQRPFARFLDWSAIQAVTLIEGIHRLISPKDGIEDLWQSWGQTDIWRLPHGHVGVCCGFVLGLPERVLRWLAPRLEPQLLSWLPGSCPFNTHFSFFRAHVHLGDQHAIVVAGSSCRQNRHSWRVEA